MGALSALSCGGGDFRPPAAEALFRAYLLYLASLSAGTDVICECANTNGYRMMCCCFDAICGSWSFSLSGFGAFSAL